MCKDPRGFTLVELLIVIAIIGIIAAIAIPNLLNAIQRGKQKRTISDLRALGTSIESYEVDTGFPPVLTSGSVSILSPTMEPTYIKQLPRKDAWRQAFYYVHASATDRIYSLVSYGKDMQPQGNLRLGATTSFNDDIYFSAGQFSVYPEGTQN